MITSARISVIFACAACCAAAFASVDGTVGPIHSLAGKTAAPEGNAGSHGRLLGSFDQFTHVWFITRLVVGLVLSVLLALLIAAHPRRSTRLDPLSDLEERKTLILMGMVGAVVAELVSVESTMALVIFGIGGLIRFRTILRNPKITGKAILVVLIGLACGLGQFATAIFVTAFAWALIMWLESHLSARIKVRVHERINLHDAYVAVLEYLRAKHCRVKSSMLVEGKHQVVAMIHYPSGRDPKAMETDLKAAMPRGGEGCDVEIEVE
ncbi:MAG: hypothetical protein FJ292_05450 [Planctomycetes bacterium]|nr:hypothetical protein [Planctomycetota bacterium]